MGKRNKQPDQGVFALWVESIAGPLGGYRCAIKADDRLVRELSPAQAHAYASEIEYAVVWAEYDAAVMKQLLQVKMELRLIGRTIRELRESRRPIRQEAIAPLTVTPILSQSDLVGRLTCDLDGIGFQWELDEARKHARHVREVTLSADLDGVYRTYLQGQIGLERDEAKAYVALLRQFTPDS